jgi:hypothetical protein
MLARVEVSELSPNLSARLGGEDFLLGMNRHVQARKPQISGANPRHLLAVGRIRHIIGHILEWSIPEAA